MKESVERITLIENDQYWKYNTGGFNQPCALCGNKLEPCGFDFFLSDTEQFVCKECAAKHAPELVEIQENALFYTSVVTGRERDQLFNKLTETISAVFNNGR